MNKLVASLLLAGAVFSAAPLAASAAYDLSAGPAGSALLQAAAMSPGAGGRPETLKMSAGEQFGDASATTVDAVVAAPGRPGERPRLDQDVAKKNSKKGPAITYVIPSRVQKTAVTGGALGGIGGYLVAGLWGGVAGALIGWGAGTFIGHKIRQPGIGMIAGGGAAAAVGWGAGGMVLGAIAGGLLGLVLSFLLK